MRACARAHTHAHTHTHTYLRARTLMRPRSTFFRNLNRTSVRISIG